MKKLTLIYCLYLLCAPVFAGVYDTLPTGIKTLVVKQVGTSKIESRYGADKETSGLKLKEDFNTSRLQTVSDAVANYFQELKNLSPDAYNQFSLGEFKANAWAEVNAQGYGVGYGITDRLTALISVPVYHVKTHIDFIQSKKSNLAAIKATIQNSPSTTASGNFVKDLTMQLPDTNEELFQSLIVNFYGYKPLGHFERDALGDTELGMIYRLTDLRDRGQAIAAGVIVPTGRIDDPDSLQDISTGDGQYDVYIESLSGISLLDKTLQFDFKLKYTYQFGTKKDLRLLSSTDLPLSRDKRLVYEKLGNKIDSTFTATINPTYWLNINTSYIITCVN
jgi:hypothetical protein